jgi:hypothetical protein
MEQFYTNTHNLPLEQKMHKFDQMIGFLRQQNSHQAADTFLELKNCYKPSFFKDDSGFRIYLAWYRVFDLPNDKLLRHIVAQG